MELNQPVKFYWRLAAYLDTSITKTIGTEWFHHENEVVTEFKST